jgi:hypothetical protein
MQPDDPIHSKSEDVVPATDLNPAAEEERREEVELENEFAEAKTPKELFKKIKRQLKGMAEFITKMREMDRYNRKWLEKRLEKAEEEIYAVRVEVKSLKNLYKKEGKD